MTIYEPREVTRWSTRELDHLIGNGCQADGRVDDLV